MGVRPIRHSSRRVCSHADALNLQTSLGIRWARRAGQQHALCARVCVCKACRGVHTHTHTHTSLLLKVDAQVCELRLQLLRFVARELEVAEHDEAIPPVLVRERRLDAEGHHLAVELVRKVARPLRVRRGHHPPRAASGSSPGASGRCPSAAAACVRRRAPPTGASSCSCPAACTRCHVTTRWTMSVRSGIAHTSERSLAMPARGSSHDESHACTKSSELCGTAASIRGSSTSSRRRFFCWNGRRCSCGTGGCSGGVARNRALEGPSNFNIPDGLAAAETVKVVGEKRRRGGARAWTSEEKRLATRRRT